MGMSLFAGRLGITLVLAIHTIVPLISESLLCNTPVNGNSPKVSVYFSLFLYLVLIMSPPIPKMITDAVYFISSA